MDSSAEEIGALYEAVVFLNYFKDLPDVRQSGKVKYPLDEILLLLPARRRRPQVRRRSRT